LTHPSTASSWGGAVDHESVAGWISPRAPLKLLISIKALGLTLSTVSHLCVLDRDAPVRGHALADLNATLRRRFPVLSTHHRERFEVGGQRLRDGLEVLVHPSLQRTDLTLHDLDGGGLLLGVAPIDIETCLDAGSKQQGGACTEADGLRLDLQELRRDS